MRVYEYKKTNLSGKFNIVMFELLKSTIIGRKVKTIEDP